MLHEIARYTEALLSDEYVRGLYQDAQQPEPGLHLLVELRLSEGEEQAGYEVKGKPTLLGKKPHPSEAAPYKAYAPHYKFVTMNQALDTGKAADGSSNAKKIHSCTPFVMAFKKDSLPEVPEATTIVSSLPSAFKKDSLPEVPRRIPVYFENARATCLQDESDEGERLRQHSKAFEAACKALVADFAEGKHKFDELKDGEYVVVYLWGADGEAFSVEEYHAPAHGAYLSKKLFNSDEFNQSVASLDGQTTVYGLSAYHNGLNAKKPFLAHKTAAFHKGINVRVSEAVALAVHTFGDLSRKKLLPNPLPLFIDREELNVEAVRIFNDIPDKPRMGFRQIVKQLYEEGRVRDFGNYYLLFQRGGEILDLDYVPGYRFELKDAQGEAWSVENVMSIREKPDKKAPKGTLPPLKKGYPVKTLFEFETKALQPAFNDSLIKEEGGMYKYFDDIEPQYCDNGNPEMYRLVLSYRRACFDFVYKGRRQAITAPMWKDVLLNGILSDLRKDRKDKKKKDNRTFPIREKLNLFFSLNAHFDPHHQNTNGIDMASRIPELQEKMRAVANSKEEPTHFESDEEFLYGAGQVIYFLLEKSQSSNRSHALLEPFLQKTRCDLLQSELRKLIQRYGHAVDFGKGRFERLSRETLGYETAIDLRAHQHLMLAGYFANSVIYEKKQEEKKQEQENEAANA